MRTVLLLTTVLTIVSGPLYAQEKTLLDISIAAFDPNLPDSSLQVQQSGIYPAVRQAEVRYLPSFLKLLLEDSGHWGVVRLLPGPDTGAELQISATIVVSDGNRLELALSAVDATGRAWLDKTYIGAAVESVSLNEDVLGTDPFLYMFGTITGDLLSMYQSLDADEVMKIKNIATLRYGAALAPDVFDAYLSQDETGLYQLTRFPADNDPFLERILEIREHEYVFIDVVDEQYENFFVSIKPVYDLWRRYRREMLTSEADKVRLEVEQGTDFRRGSYMSLRESYNNYRWSRLQDQYLDEINTGFTNEVLPTDITLEDSLFHLSGTLDEQYQEWRYILKELYTLDNPGAQ